MKGKKLLTISLIMTMVLAMIPGSAYAGNLSDSDSQPGIKNQIVEWGGILYYNADGEETDASEDWAVSVSKTISAREGENENQFTIDLVVETTQDIKKVDISPDLAVVLVIDISTSMMYPINTTAGDLGSLYNSTDYNEYQHGESRMAIAKTQARAFLTSYTTDAGDAHRWVALVAFGSEARLRESWVDVNAGNGMEKMCQAIDKLVAVDGQYTFLQGGLQLAENQLRKTEIDEIITTNRFVVLLTDGNPTYRKTNISSVDTSVDTELINGASMAYSYGTSVENELNVPPCRAAAKQVANQIKKNATIYTIATGTPSDTFSVAEPNRPIPERITAFVWLRDHIASDESCSYKADNKVALQLAFESISRHMISWSEAWTVTDPMGIGIVFDDSVDGTYTFLNDAKDIFTWNLKKAPISRYYTRDSGNKKTVFVYEYSYDVTLDTFTRTSDGATNGPTDLVFYMVYDENSVETRKGPHRVEFLVPSVKGYTADLQFLKTGEGEALLDGAVFQLWYGDEPYATFSSEDGVARLNSIPSGHTYTLIETTAPLGYLVDETPYEVTVSYGNISITPTPYASNSGFYTNDCCKLCFKNSPEIPVVTEGTLVISASATSTTSSQTWNNIVNTVITKTKIVSESYGSVTATNTDYKDHLPVNSKNGNYLPNDSKNGSVIVPNSNHFTFATLDLSKLKNGEPIELALVVGNKVDQIGTASVQLVNGKLEITINGFYAGKFGAMAFNKMPNPSNGNVHSAKDKDLQNSWGGTAAKFDANLSAATVTIPMPVITNDSTVIYLYIHGDFQFDLTNNNPDAKDGFIWTEKKEIVGVDYSAIQYTTTKVDVFVTVYDSEGITCGEFTFKGDGTTPDVETLELPAGTYIIKWTFSCEEDTVHEGTIEVIAGETVEFPHISAAFEAPLKLTQIADRELAEPIIKIVIKK
jgi:hypothetical protein